MTRMKLIFVLKWNFGKVWIVERASIQHQDKIYPILG